MKTIGLIGGLSWESTVPYYQHLNLLARDTFGGLHSAPIVLWSFDFAEIEALQAEGDWTGAAERMADAGQRLAQAGAEVMVIASNTMHRMAGHVEAAAGVPLVHIADATAEAIRADGSLHPVLLGTKYTMEGAFYRGRMTDLGLDVRLPDEAGRARVHDVIYDELCRGVITSAARADYVDIIDHAVERGADSVIFGCTEVGLLLGQDDVGVPVFDSTRIHAEAAFRLAAAEALSGAS
ncbi:aspartate/glutamate racemase family protein [Acuticoccus mangrovi]|uniref:Aspartate/glutamate racemase family protein n=1 Tax=Acuticoccus mangrovi TaxID=2796142 RepID=A0A934IGT6_9HYPH|nr:aspartate/glutamate racemase family protein [Acuticoccus mangrovi]